MGQRPFDASSELRFSGFHSTRPKRGGGYGCSPPHHAGNLSFHPLTGKTRRIIRNPAIHCKQGGTKKRSISDFVGDTFDAVKMMDPHRFGGSSRTGVHGAHGLECTGLADWSARGSRTGVREAHGLECARLADWSARASWTGAGKITVREAGQKTFAAVKMRYAALWFSIYRSLAGPFTTFVFPDMALQHFSFSAYNITLAPQQGEQDTRRIAQAEWAQRGVRFSRGSTTFQRQKPFNC